MNLTSKLGYQFQYCNVSTKDNLLWWNHDATQQRSSIGLDTTRTGSSGTTKYLLSPSGKPLGYKWAPSGQNWANDGGAYYLTDRQGTVTSLAAGDNGIEAAIYRYSPYGEWRVADEHYDGAKANRIQFHGLLYDDATGLYRTDTRWYDPTTGRFTQPDTTAYETNPYLYAGSSQMRV
ncbi:RHS repeat-associated core domain-containing protein [Arsenicicoccus cauae]|uniref:RHS repeat-associated core domain-containing protein n=1 Tax=Arsenicicoccus cauae TaxID=2663847 RepID=UPI00370DB9F9